MNGEEAVCEIEQRTEKMVIHKKPNCMYSPKYRINAVLIMVQTVQELCQVSDASQKSLSSDMFLQTEWATVYSHLEQSYLEIQLSTLQQTLLALQLHRPGMNSLEISVWSNGDREERVTWLFIFSPLILVYLNSQVNSEPQKQCYKYKYNKYKTLSCQVCSLEILGYLSSIIMARNKPKTDIRNWSITSNFNMS